MKPLGDPDARIESIIDALMVTKATLKNGDIAYQSPEVLVGIETILNHTRIEGDVRRVEVAFGLTAYTDPRLRRIGAAVASALVSQPSILTAFDDPVEPRPWHIEKSQWAQLLTFLFEQAEIFVDLALEDYKNFQPSTRHLDLLEALRVNRRKDTDAFIDDKLALWVENKRTERNKRGTTPNV